MELTRLRNATSAADLKVRHVPTTEQLFDLHWAFKCKIKILVVTDNGSGGYSDTSGFHLGQVLKIVLNDLWPHVSFEFTKAHRQTVAGSGADISNFRFDTQNLTQYDEIWLFGINGTGPDALSDKELKALTQFMDKGGGLFATGDHENLGQAMAARVPRARVMRRWYFPGAGPNGEPAAPNQSGPGRHDTLVDDPATASPVGDQSDDIPQVIQPRWYTAWTFSPIFGKLVRFPHPVLCGPKGPITHLPDHMHEGHCEVPSDLSKSFTFDGYKTTEFPTLNGHQQSPEVIAWATSAADTNDRQFGVLGAYDGHRSGVGRVVVDATWHHWFNINLTGFLASTDPKSPTFDPAVVPEWEEIKSYYRNVAAWLAPKAKQRCMRNGGWLILLKNNEVRMTLASSKDRAPSIPYYWQLGVFARDALGRLASQCQHRVWICDLFKMLDVEALLPDPWGPEPPNPIQGQLPAIQSADLETVALGAAVHALGTKFADEQDLQRLVDKGSEDIEALAAKGAADGVAQLLQGLREGTETALRLADGLNAKR
ncbi:MAG TPA: hypothetical protein VF526_03280 [Solirubrobacteraceae bacterium]|jgi:hypothetical protein